MMMNSIYLSDWANSLVPGGNLARSLSNTSLRSFINPTMLVRFSVFLCERGSDKSLILGLVLGYRRNITTANECIMYLIVSGITRGGFEPSNTISPAKAIPPPEKRYSARYVSNVVES